MAAGFRSLVNWIFGGFSSSPLFIPGADYYLASPRLIAIELSSRPTVITADGARMTYIVDETRLTETMRYSRMIYVFSLED